MNRLKKYKTMAFLSVFPPLESEVAAFTQDLITTIDSLGIINTQVITINDSEESISDNKVMASIRQNARIDYVNLAIKLNNSNIDLLVIDHEFSFYGGEYGDYILDLINKLEIPFVTIFHTILSDPAPQQKLILNELGIMSDKVITMAHNSKQILEAIYGIEAEKIEVIHHGVPKKPFETREILKKKLGYQNSQIISTFGLMEPEKGIEYGIEAIGKVIAASTGNDANRNYNQDVLYLILGQTPLTEQEEGLPYENKLKKLVEKLNLSQNVVFINDLSKDEIINYLQLSDIVMTPDLIKDQAVNATLAYAMGYGKAVVSTPYLYANEMLSEGRGVFAEFGDADSLAECLNGILNNPLKKAKMEKYTLKIGRTMYWDRIAHEYVDILLSIISSNLQVVEV